MPIKYKYTLENQSIETLDLDSIPLGVSYEKIEDTIEVSEIDSIAQATFKRLQARKELKETDWYIVRFVETGKEIPEEILKLREEIRNNV